MKQNFFVLFVTFVERFYFRLVQVRIIPINYA
jgi:hypothetical protein